MIQARRRRRSADPGGDRPLKRTYPLKWVALALAVTAVLLIGGPWLFLAVIDRSTPGQLHLPSVAGAASRPLQPGPVTGTWTVISGSQAGYRVQEVLFGASHAAVGRTSQVSGGMVISGTQITAADFTVNMSSVKSDQGARDYQFRTFIMDTADYPHSTFRLTEPIGLGAVPAVGQKIDEQATGELSLRGVVRPISFELSAERTSATQIDVNAEIPITFSLWHIPNPSFAVAQVGSTGTLEVLLQLSPTGTKSQQPITTTTIYTPGTL